ncbi:MAG: twin-arginine translocase TatA/TatE family subunit [Methylococcaceae bacterium]|nr:twin-arginine translocase TatA/TatE family subunit [Methylococcaceae bacterium]
MRIGMWELLLILLIVVLLFGTRRLKTVGGDLGAAIKGFKTVLRGDEETSA